MLVHMTLRRLDFSERTVLTLSSCVIAIMIIAGYEVGTVRSSDINAERTRIRAEWNDLRSDLEVSMANINTMSTGVNLHKCYSKGIFVNWHLNAQVQEQTITRIVRIGQTRAVHWQMVKLKNRYHDNIERLSVTKWMAQLAVETRLPCWVEHELREICICETIKMYWNQKMHGLSRRRRMVERWNIIPMIIISSAMPFL